MATIDLVRTSRRPIRAAQQVVHGIDLAIEDGELVVLVGPSGCGKSTLLRMIAGLETVTDGTISIAGNVVNRKEPAERDIAMVFQNYALYPHMSVRGNLEYGLKNRGTPRSMIDERVAEAARILEITPFLDRKPRQLSGGQRQRVAMGRAIVRQPKAFLFDEPLSNLDAKLRGQMRIEIRRLQRTLGTTSVYVTHDQLEAMTLADRLVVMNGGKIEQVGKPIELYDRPASLFVAGFIGSPPMNLFDVDKLKSLYAADFPQNLPAGTGIVGVRPDAIVLGKECAGHAAVGHGRDDRAGGRGKPSLCAGREAGPDGDTGGAGPHRTGRDRRDGFRAAACGPASVQQGDRPPPWRRRFPRLWFCPSKGRNQSGSGMVGLSQRHRSILDLARREDRVSVEALAAHFGVSVQTIRKDLNELCDQRLLKRVHGGAELPSGIENLEYEARRQIAAAEKDAIGRAAARADPQ